MPKFTLPAKKKSDKKDNVMVGSMDDFRRHVHIPANAKILQALSIGDTCTVMLEGKVSELSSHESSDHKDRHFGVEITSVEAYPETQQKAEKDFSKGYKRGMEQ